MKAEIDTRMVGHVAADLMEQVAEQFGEEATVETVAMVVAVRHADDATEEATTISCACSDPRAWVQVGLLHFAANLVERQATSP